MHGSRQGFSRSQALARSGGRQLLTQARNRHQASCSFAGNVHFLPPTLGAAPQLPMHHPSSSPKLPRHLILPLLLILLRQLRRLLLQLLNRALRVFDLAAVGFHLCSNHQPSHFPPPSRRIRAGRAYDTLRITRQLIPPLALVALGVLQLLLLLLLDLVRAGVLVFVYTLPKAFGQLVLSWAHGCVVLWICDIRSALSLPASAGRVVWNVRMEEVVKGFERRARRERRRRAGDMVADGVRWSGTRRWWVDVRRERSVC